MKTFRYLIVLLAFATGLIACKKDDEPKPNNNTQQEVLPPDNDPVSGSIDGEIDEEAYNEALSESSITINRTPHTLAKFLELRDQIAHTPQGAVVMMLVAFRIYQKYPIEGMKCLTANCTSPLIVPSTAAGSYEGHAMGNTNELKRKLADYAYMPLIYYKGASPSNGYTPDGPPYQIEMFVNQYSYMSSTDGSLRIKVFVRTQAADSPRPAVARKVGNIYKLTEYSSLYLAPKPLNP